MLTMIRPRAATVSTSAVPAHPADVIGLDDIAARGQADSVHRFTHHLFLPGEDAAVAAAVRLEAAGWTVERLSAMPAPFPGWTLRVYRDTVIDARVLDDARTTFELVAHEAAGEYAGWDAFAAPRHATA